MGTSGSKATTPLTREQLEQREMFEKEIYTFKDSPLTLLGKSQAGVVAKNLWKNFGETQKTLREFSASSVILEKHYGTTAKAEITKDTDLSNQFCKEVLKKLRKIIAQGDYPYEVKDQLYMKGGKLHAVFMIKDSSGDKKTESPTRKSTTTSSESGSESGSSSGD